MRVSLSQQCFIPSCVASGPFPTGISSSGSPPTQNVSSCTNHSFPGDENTCINYLSDQSVSGPRSCCHDNPLQYTNNYTSERWEFSVGIPHSVRKAGSSIPTNRCSFRSSTPDKAKL